MRKLKDEIVKLFQNEKVGDLFAQSYGGFDMIYLEIEKKFTFHELLELKDTSQRVIIQSYLANLDNEGLELASAFIKSFQVKVTELYEKYENAGQSECIYKVIIQKQNDIYLKYPNKSPENATIHFYKKYKSTHKGLGDITYDQCRGFFKDPVSFIN